MTVIDVSVLALIPARSGSKGVPNKNFASLAGRSPLNRVIDVCNALRGILTNYVVSSDVDWAANERVFEDEPMWRYGRWLLRPAELAQDDTPMIAVVQHALRDIPGPPNQILVLLQPTQPLRKPEHITKAISLLRESGADSVVSVVELPPTHAGECQLNIVDVRGRIRVLPRMWGAKQASWNMLPRLRQHVSPVYIRDGTVYAFWRKTVSRYKQAPPRNNIYGNYVVPLIIPASESCPLDTLEDWEHAEGLLLARQRT